MFFTLTQRKKNDHDPFTYASIVKKTKKHNTLMRIMNFFYSKFIFKGTHFIIYVIIHLFLEHEKLFSCNLCYFKIFFQFVVQFFFNMCFLEFNKTFSLFYQITLILNIYPSLHFYFTLLRIQGFLRAWHLFQNKSSSRSVTQ